MVGKFQIVEGNDTDGMFRWKEGINRRYAVLGREEIGIILMFATAGSALIQACEKAGVTIPRYSSCKQHFPDILLTLILDTATMSEFRTTIFPNIC